MEWPYTLILGTLTAVLTITFLVLCRKQHHKPSKFGGAIFSLIGMLIGASSSLLVFFSIDTTKGWNPYGWWFPATFIATVLGGFCALIIYAKIAKHKTEISKKQL